MEDDIIPFDVGKELYNKSKSPYKPWWVKGGGHTDISVKHEAEFKQRLADFMKYCESYKI